MEIKESDYVLGIWHAADEEDNDWLMVVLQRNGEWLGEYRFRYKKDNKVFGSKDLKNFYSFKIPKDVKEEEILIKMNSVLEAIKLKYPEGEFISIKGNVDKFMFILAQQPWAHVKITNKEDFEKIKKGELDD